MSVIYILLYNSSIYEAAVVAAILLCVCRWIKLDDGSSPTPLYLSTASSGDDTLLEESVQVCTIGGHEVGPLTESACS